MDRQYQKKFQVVFLIDKSFEHAKDFLNHRHNRLRCKNIPEEKQQRSLNDSSSNSVCDCGAIIEDIDQLKSRVWKSISLSALRILCYLFTKNHPGDSSSGKSASDDEEEDWDNNEEDVDNNKQAATDLKNQIEYLTGKQSSLQWGYKFFNSNKLTGKTEHHQLKDFKLRYFEEFEKDLEKQFDELNVNDDSLNLNPKTKPSSKKDDTSASRKSTGPTSSECLKRTLSHVLYDFNWENPDITSPVISRKSFSKKRKRSSNSGGLDCSGISSGPQNLVFLFQSCPSSRLELRHFAGKVVVDSEVFLDSFMPPSLFKEFVVNRNISLYWVDHQIHDDILHMNVSNYESESFGIVNEALVKLSGTLIPLDSLTVAGSKHWSSIYSHTRWANHLFLEVNSCQQPSQFGKFLDKKSEADDDFPPLLDKSKASSKDKRSKYQDNGRGLLPVTSVLDHFLKGPSIATSTLVKDGSNIVFKRPNLEATLVFDQNENQPELCPLKLVPTNSSSVGTLEKFFTHFHSSNSGNNVHISMTDKHKMSRDEPKPDVEFTLTKPHLGTSSSAPSSSSPLVSMAQESISLQLEVYSYLNSGDICSTSNYTFFCSVCIPSKFNTNKPSSPKSSPLLNIYAKFQSLILRLAEADQNLVLTVKMDGESTPFLAVLQPLSVSLGLVVFFPLGLSLDLEKHLFSKSGQNVTKEKTNSVRKFEQNETEYFDYITHRFAKRLWRSKYIDIPAKKEMSKLNVFDSAILNKWSLPRVNNPEMVKMSLTLGKNIATDTASCAARETNLFKQLKTFYRQADSPSQLVDKNQQEEEEGKKKSSENMSEESVCQNTTASGGEPKPRLLQKLLSFNLGSTRAEMILSKSMQVVEQQSKVDKDDSAGICRSSRMSVERELQVATVVKQIADDSALSNYIKEFYDSTITENLNSWNRIHHLVAVVHSYMKEQSKNNPEDEAKKFLEESVYLSSCSLRQKYQDPSLSSKKQDKILEYQLQIILRMEILSYLKLSSEDQQTDEEERDDNEESPVDIFVEEIVTMLRTLSFITNAAIVPVFLTDVLLKNYADTLTRPLADIYNELMQPLPSILSTSVDSPQSSVQSSFCPSTVSTSFLDETTRDGFPELGATQAKRVKTMQVVPGLGEGVKRQIVVGKKPALKKKNQKNLAKDTKNKKTEENDDKERVRARRSLFVSEKKNLERHRSFAVRDKDKSRSHRTQRYSHRHGSKHSRLKSSSAEKHSKTMVAETPAHKQLSHMMRRWHLLQNRLTEPIQENQSPCTEVNLTPKRATLDTTVSVIEESPLKEGIPIQKLSENSKKTTVLIRRGFYGLNNEKSQSRNLTKYLELADRIAGRRDRYAQLTDLSTVSQMHESIQSPVNKPSTFALSQLMGSPSSNSPKLNDYSTVLKYTPDRKSPSFPFSTSPKLPTKSLERVSFKQALFRTPEKTVARSQTLILQSPNMTSRGPSPSVNRSPVNNKVALFNSPPNGSNCIFKTPTKEPVCIFKSPDKTPTFKKFSTTPVKSIALTLLSKSRHREAYEKRKLSGGYTDKPLPTDNEARSLKSQRLCSANSLLASPPLLSKSSLHSDPIETTPTKYPKTSDKKRVKSSSENKLKKCVLTPDDNNNSTDDLSAFPSNSKKSLPSASLSECSYKTNLRRTRSKHRLALQSDETCESRDSVLPQESLSSTSQPEDVIEPLAKRKRKRLSESVSDVTSPVANKRSRRSLNCAQSKSQSTKEDQEESQRKNIYTNRTRRSTVIHND